MNQKFGFINIDDGFGFENNPSNSFNDKSQLLIDLKGEPGKNCGGFCKFCYFRKVNFNNPEPLGCRQCTFQIGCNYCTNSIREINGSFIPLPFALDQVQNSLLFKKYEKVNITSGGDTSYYPYIEDLCKILKQMGLKIHLGYTSGKGLKGITQAKNLVECGVNEVTFSVFATDPNIRREWMNDQNPEQSLECLKYFCETCETHCAIIVVPGINDGEVLKNTIADLVSWGANAVILMRFANKTENGLIFENEPLVDGIEVPGIEEFGKIVTEMHELFGEKIRISGTPVYDPLTNTPFAICNEEKVLNELRSKIRAEATIITGNVSYIYLKKIFEGTPIKVVRVNKDIADLITKKDLETVDLSEITDTVFYPENAIVHERDAEDILTADGVKRIVLRGVDKLTMDGEVSGIFTKEEAINFEIGAFTELIEKINFFGNPI